MSTSLLYFAADAVALIGDVSWGLFIGLLWAGLIVVGVAIHLPEKFEFDGTYGEDDA